MRKTMGSLSVPDLLESAQSELDGLSEFIERVAKYSDEDARWIRAFHGSISLRINLAKWRVEDVIEMRKPTLYLESAQ
jgi:hypothetical protein